MLWRVALLLKISEVMLLVNRRSLLHPKVYYLLSCLLMLWDSRRQKNCPCSCPCNRSIHYFPRCLLLRRALLCWISFLLVCSLLVRRIRVFELLLLGF